MWALLIALLLSPLPAGAESCGGDLVQICPDGGGESVTALPRRKVLRQRVPDAEFKAGDVFPIADHSLLMDPVRYGLPAVTGRWRYYALEGFVYRVDAVTNKVIDVRRSKDRRLW